MVNLNFIMVSEEASKMDRDDGGAEQDAEPVVVEPGTKRGNAAHKWQMRECIEGGPVGK